MITPPLDILTGTEEFTRAAGLPMANNPRFPAQKLRNLRIDLLIEEYEEYLEGEAANDMVAVADGLLDIIVIAWGTLLTYVGPERARAAAAEVASSNLAKIVDGQVIRRTDGKILKPEGWTPPDIKGAIYPGLPDCCLRFVNGGPGHTPSQMCRSGSRPHCTCDACF